MLAPCATAQDVIDIGSRRELFADRYLVGNLSGAELKLHSPQSAGAVFHLDKPWEGIVSACAARALGAQFSWRLDPQLQTELAGIRRAGLPTDRWYTAEDLVASDETFVCATGIASGLLLEGVARTPGEDRLQTLTIAGGERKLMTTWRPSVEVAGSRS